MGLDDITPDYDRSVTFQTKTEAIREMHALGNYTRLTDKYPIRTSIDGCTVRVRYYR
jgi:hypothetical protein